MSNGEDAVIGMAIGFLLGWFAMIFFDAVSDNTFNDGVIAAQRGQYVAKLVERADGTNEWKVEKVQK